MHEGTATDAAAPPDVAAAVGADVPAPVAGRAVGEPFSAAGAHAAASPLAPRSASVSRRVRMRPIGASSSARGIVDLTRTRRSR